MFTFCGGYLDLQYLQSHNLSSDQDTTGKHMYLLTFYIAHFGDSFTICTPTSSQLLLSDNLVFTYIYSRLATANVHCSKQPWFWKDAKHQSGCTWCCGGRIWDLFYSDLSWSSPCSSSWSKSRTLGCICSSANKNQGQQLNLRDASMPVEANV